MQRIELNGLYVVADRPVKCYLVEDEGKHIAAIPELGVSLAIDPEELQESFRKGIKTFENPLFPVKAVHAMEQIYRYLGYEAPDYI